MNFQRTWAMPSKDTFSVRPIGEFVRKYLEQSQCSIDPFARNNAWATHTNDINPNTSATHHMDAVEFLGWALREGICPDLVILDAPYSPRQISECYKEIGKPVTMHDTQNAAFYKRVRDAVEMLAAPGMVVLSFGWNSSGMGESRGYKLLEVQLVCHGGAHNDTICLAEEKL